MSESRLSIFGDSAVEVKAKVTTESNLTVVQLADTSF